MCSLSVEFHPLASFVRAVVGTLCFSAGYSMWTQSTGISGNISVYLLLGCRNAGGDSVGTIPAAISIHV